MKKCIVVTIISMLTLFGIGCSSDGEMEVDSDLTIGTNVLTNNRWSVSEEIIYPDGSNNRSFFELEFYPDGSAKNFLVGLVDSVRWNVDGNTFRYTEMYFDGLGIFQTNTDFKIKVVEDTHFEMEGNPRVNPDDLRKWTVVKQ